jgi:hypothetical protein
MSRAEQKKRKAEYCEENILALKGQHGLLLCNARCPETGRNCTKSYLTEQGLNKHATSGKHSFPQSMKSGDRILLLASRTGGALEIVPIE